MKITWYGTASILIETEQTALLFDPFLKEMPEGWESPVVFAKRKAVFQEQKNIFITHGHIDHLSSVPILFSEGAGLIYLTKSPMETLVSRGFQKERCKEIRPGDWLEFPDVKVRVLQGAHVKFDKGLIMHTLFCKRTWKMLGRLFRIGRLHIQYPEYGETVIYEIEAEGKRIQLMGSAELVDGVAYPKEADLLILPHQGRSDIDIHNQSIVRQLKPKRILLNHYDDAFPPVSTAVPVDEFCREMSKEIPTEKMVEGVTVFL